jgi:glycerol-3-phosphate dehydrogenase (NAD(P)+)
MQVGVVGAGSWGTAVAGLAASTTDTLLWARRPDLARAIAATHENPDYLPGYQLPRTLDATSNLQDIASADVVIMGVPSHGYRDVLEQCATTIRPEALVVSLSKGIEQSTLMRMTEVTRDVLTNHDPNRIGVLSGPNLAREITAGQPAATVIAMPDLNNAETIQRLFMSGSFRVYTNRDVVGCESAGALKNVMAIAAGMARGLEFGHNTMATLITRALAELTRLGVAMGGEPLTFSGLAGMGDLIATCMSSQSRNNQVGVALGQGRKLDDIISDMNMVAEGVKSTKGVLQLADRYGIEMPIATQVGRVLYEGASPNEVLKELMGREAKRELHGIRD